MTSVSGRPTLAEIDLTKLGRNLISCRRFIGDDLTIMAVVKADAYGHGAVQCSNALESKSVDWFGVATPEEALELRAAGIVSRILCLGGLWVGAETDFVKNNITPAIFELSAAEQINEAARKAGLVIPIHIKFDTGMGRLGFRWDDIPRIAKALRSFSNLRIEGVMTHFASADDLMAMDFTTLQITRFREALDTLRAAGHSPEIIDLSNSPGAVAMGANGGNLVRLGGVLYGLGDDVLPEGITKPELEPVMSIRSEIAHLKTLPIGESIGYGRTFYTERESRIAAVPIGYHDGYRRGLSNKAYMAVRGRPVPVVGRISMDWTMIDVTEIDAVSLGDRVTIIGRDDGHEVRATGLARLIDTISYEVTCGISARVPRVFVTDQTAS
jgi:alanine racemase